MRRFFNRKSIAGMVIALALVAAFASGIVLHGNSTAARASGPTTTTKSAFCSKLGHSIQASAGAQMYCFGAQANGPAAIKHPAATRVYGPNVDAANPTEDQAPSGVQGYGQSEVSIAFSGQYVVEAWNDATAFFAGCGSPMNKEEGTGFGFSNNGGKSFTDLGGLPNTNCANYQYQGDPSVEAYQVGGKTYFYISSLFNITFTNATDSRSYIAMAACVVKGSGSSATLSCSQPIIVASSSECVTSPFTFCSFLDKDFLSIDPARGLLYATFTEFGIVAHPDDIELAVCDIGNGALGGTAAAPVCTNGGSGSTTTPAAPYFVVAPADTVNFCEKEGAYPAVNRANGDVYVAYEYNWGSALNNGPCSLIPVQESVNYIAKSCLTLPTASCTAPTKSTAVNIKSMQGAFIPGYNRFPMNDFPRIATSSKGTVSIVWNDTRYHPAGDILMQSFWLGSLGALSGPVVLDSDPGGWHFLPALRYANSNGILTVSWYDRSSANTAITSVAAAQVNPLKSSTPSNSTVTNVPSDWNAVSSDIVPNFGDYTDNYVSGTQVFVAWSDGRLGDPQPFNASRTAN